MSTVFVEAAAPGVNVVTMNRPDKLNAMNEALVTELHEALATAGAEPSCRVIVLTGAGRAHELMLTGRFVDADEALRIGLVTDVVPDEALLDRVLDEAALIARNSPMGVFMTKEVMWSALEIPGMTAAMDLENRTQIM